MTICRFDEKKEEETDTSPMVASRLHLGDEHEVS
jgi:hypothetical protein